MSKKDMKPYIEDACTKTVEYLDGMIQYEADLKYYQSLPKSQRSEYNTDI